MKDTILSLCTSDKSTLLKPPAAKNQRDANKLLYSYPIFLLQALHCVYIYLHSFFFCDK